jgi:hypothetical protein
LRKRKSLKLENHQIKLRSCQTTKFVALDRPRSSDCFGASPLRTGEPGLQPVVGSPASALVSVVPCFRFTEYVDPVGTPGRAGSPTRATRHGASYQHLVPNANRSRQDRGALTPRCGRYHGESGGANPGGVGEHFLPRDPFERRLHVRRRRRRSCGRSACSALSARRGGDGLAHADSRAVLRRAFMGGWGGRRETAHNVTAAADYRTALLSDSP